MQRLSDRARLYAYARKHIPAYAAFLKNHKTAPSAVSYEEDFMQIPVTDKKRYLKRYRSTLFFPDGVFPALAYASSGSSGTPTFWFRTPEQERVGQIIHERIVRDGFDIDPKESTLVIISFSMGIWVAGHYTFASFKKMAEAGYRFSIITPAIEKEDNVRAFELLAPQFEHVILAGYPPFIMDILTEVKRRHIRFPKQLHVLASGDAFSEAWRDAIAELAGIAHPNRNIAGVYGSADCTVMGFETPLSVQIRRAADANPLLRKALFGDAFPLPSLVQYDPQTIYFEEERGELLVTAAMGTPLIRYNIHDRGALFSSHAMHHALRDCGATTLADHVKKSRAHLPFIALKGRSDVAVTFYALNVYPEHIRACLDARPLQAIVSGNFVAYNKTTHRERNQKLVLAFELQKGKKATKTILERAGHAVLATLTAISTEFRKLHSALGARALPTVQLVPYGMLRMPKLHGGGGMLGAKGKKTKIVVS